jgi:hypothetical protein
MSLDSRLVKLYKEDINVEQTHASLGLDFAGPSRSEFIANVVG